MTHHALPRLAQRIFNTPLAIHPTKAEMVVAALADRLGVAQMFRLENELSASMAMSDNSYGFAERGENPRVGYDMVGPVARIEVSGTLVQKLGTVRPYSGMTGYDGIRQNLFAAMDDPKVSGIVLDIDSPGGEVSGCFDLVDTIYELRGTKPMWAILNENAFSAAYAIASATDYITAPRTGGVDTIVDVTAHADYSQALDKTGIKVTFITFGDFKADCAPELPLSDEAKQRIQKDIDVMGELFVQTVARNRGISADSVRNTQAATFLGNEGVSLKLADRVAAPDAAFRELMKQLS